MSAPELELRPAAWQDAHKVWQWNNDPAAREASLQPASIPLSSHESWFRARLDEAGYFMWIAVNDARDIGVVRIDARDDGPATVSIALDPSVRGRGLGRHALARACRLFRERRPDATLQAWIERDNRASARCFEGCGFSPIGATRRGDKTFLIYHHQQEPNEAR